MAAIAEIGTFTTLFRGDVEIGLAAGFLAPPPCKQKLPDELLLMECDGDGLVDGGGGNGSVSSTGAAVNGPSSLIASTRAKLYIDEALSKDEPSCVNVCELGVATKIIRNNI